MRDGAAVALAAPPLIWIAAAAVLVTIALATGYRPFSAPDDLTLSEAAALRDELEITRQIRDGADPNRRTSVRADLVRSTPLELTPLEAAVAIRRADVMELLVAQGARIDGDNYPVLRCLAEAQDADEVIDYLNRTVANAPPVACDQVMLPW